MSEVNYFPNKEELKEQLQKLPKKSTTLKMLDFDDTIFSRYEQLNGTDETSFLLQKNRGAKGNEIITKVIGIDTMMEKYYIGKYFPKTLISKIDIHQDLILTAGLEELQQAKIKATGLDKIPLRVVFHSHEKPQTLVQYIISLGFIPKEIEIYEDRPNHFLAAKEEFETLTGSTMKIFFVEMKNNETEPRITEL